MKKFYAGMSGEFSGVQWRLTKGKKSPNDLRLEIKTVGWVPISMNLAFLQADLYAENERTLQDEGAIGRIEGVPPGARFINFMKKAQAEGWRAAARQLHEERKRKRERDRRRDEEAA